MKARELTTAAHSDALSLPAGDANVSPAAMVTPFARCALGVAEDV
jgi:hypothetical protein